jgi:hypothetical protein
LKLDTQNSSAQGDILRRFLLALPIVAALPAAMVETPVAGLALNGVKYNGVHFNGVKFNGIHYNGVRFNGIKFNGVKLNGLSTNRIATNGLASNSLGEGFSSDTPLVAVTAITLADGTVVTLAE